MSAPFPPPPELPVLLAGPTAGGKSALALRIAAAQGRVVVNADALQVHDSWRVLTARPGEMDLAAAPHALYGHVTRGQDYSVGHWLRDLAPLLDTSPAPVIVGGTGLYFTALTRGLAVIPPVPPDIRARADALLAEGGIDALLPGIDARTLAGIDTRNPARLQRAWEVRAATGRGLADWQAETGPPLLPPHRAHRLILDPGPALAARIARRFDSMLEEGALEEVRAALPHWPPAGAGNGAPPWTRAIGAPELVAHLRGHISLSQAREDAILATRQYAKRQRTWFRNRLSDWNRLPQD